MVDVSHVLRHPVLLATFAIAVPAWFIAFIAQCVAEARYNYGMSSELFDISIKADAVVGDVPVVRFLWYNIWIQL